MGTDARASLYARALRCLAQREHSRSELRTRLLQAAARPRGVAAARARGRRAAEAPDAGAAADGVGDDDLGGAREPSARSAAARAAAAELVDAVLDELQAQGYLSDDRFVESRLHVRQAGWGNRRIRHELRQHGLAPDAQQQQQLDLTERARAQALWARRFGQVATDPAERARQMRFLAARGFSGDAIRQAVAGADDELPSEPDDD